MNALFPSLLAGLATALGCLLVLFAKHPGQRTLAFILGGAAGVMLAVVILDLIPAALKTGSPLQATTGMITGAGILFLLDRFLTGKEISLSFHKGAMRRLGYLMAIGIALHDLPEGMAIAGAYAAGGKLGPLLALSIALHNIPEGIATAAPLKLGGLRYRQILLINILVSLFTPLGAMFGLFIINLSPGHLSFLLALAAGAMLYLIKDELLPAALSRHLLWCWLGLILGFALLWLAIMIV
ncbi:MAG: ZIP family metal transporter [Thermacetogeniaceae bacterium]|jgi:ZIP family zinc transporter|nr:ZIP family metal transporter [Syntrophomonadaceae bacterium]